jgi:hypothetical protein
MSSAKKFAREATIARHEDADYDVFSKKGESDVERVVGKGAAAPPVSVRLSKPLLDGLEAVARNEYRSRSNLTQRILWAHVTYP